MKSIDMNNPRRPSFLLLPIFLLISSGLWSQTSLDAIYAVNRADSNIFYGAPINYRGCPDSLFMDIYKPVNNDPFRPLVILMHGGGFVAGERRAPTIVRLADSIASRGYVVASVEYRMGFHQPPGLTPSFGCLFFSAVTGIQLDACAYPLDTAEVYRAAYRAIQDVKGAIRFLKGRAAQDSTDKNRVTLGGESAGGVLALSVATLDLPSEKPAAAGALPNAPTPTGLAVCNLNMCTTTDYSRPDLGGIDGTLWQNGENAEVYKVISFAGGLLDPTWMDSNLTHPRLYLYHQPCDPVVSFDRKKIYKDLSSCIVCAGCPGFAYAPYISGGGALATYNAQLPVNSSFDITADFTAAATPINCWYGLWGPDFNTCPQPVNTCSYCSNTIYHTCHDLLLTPSRMANISFFLYDPTIGIEDPQMRIELYPNPASESLRVSFADCRHRGGKLAIFDISGQQVSGLAIESCETEVDLQSLPAGLYFLKVVNPEGRQRVSKFVVAR